MAAEVSSFNTFELGIYLVMRLWAPIHSRTMQRHRDYMVDRHLLCDEKHRKFFPHLSVLVQEKEAVGG